MNKQKQKRTKDIIIQGIKIIIGCLFLWLSIANISWCEIKEIIIQVDIFWIIVCAASVILSLFLRLLRWKSILSTLGILVSWDKLTRAYFTGQAMNILLPIRGGEVIRIGLISENKNFLTAGASVALEKYLDLVMLLILCGAIFNTESFNSISSVFRLMSLLFFVVSFILIVINLLPHSIMRCLLWLENISKGEMIPKTLNEVL